MTPSFTFDRTRGVSPVIGVVLLVAIVVILASTVGVFVLGLAEENQTTTPTVVLSAEYEQSGPNGDSLRLMLESGDPVETANLQVRVSGAEISYAASHPAATLDGDPFASVGTTFRAGESITLEPCDFIEPGRGDPCGNSAVLDLSDATVQLVWEDGGTSDVLWTWTAE
jgi:flagellin-like protein